MENVEKQKKVSLLCSFILLLQSHQASQQTNSGWVRDQPGLPVPEARRF